MFSIIPPWVKIAAIGIAIIIAGGFGYMKGSAAADVKIAMYAKQKSDLSAAYEKKLADKKVEIVTEYVDRWNTIREKEYINVNTAKNNVPGQYNLSNAFVSLHDTSARNTEVDTTRSLDASPSGVIDNQALAVIVSNYARCHQTSQQVIGLQQTIIEHNKTIDELNEKNKK
jgi:hypothetical protein